MFGEKSTDDTIVFFSVFRKFVSVVHSSIRQICSSVRVFFFLLRVNFKVASGFNQFHLLLYHGLNGTVFSKNETFPSVYEIVWSLFSAKLSFAETSVIFHCFDADFAIDCARRNSIPLLRYTLDVESVQFFVGHFVSLSLLPVPLQKVLCHSRFIFHYQNIDSIHGGTFAFATKWGVMLIIFVGDGKHPM